MNFASKKSPDPSRHVVYVIDQVEEIYMDPPDVGKSLEEVTAMYGHIQQLIGVCRGLLMAAELRHQRDEGEG